MTTYEKLKSLPDVESFLKPGIFLADLDKQATRISDNEAARQLNDARLKLFQSILRRPKHAA